MESPLLPVRGAIRRVALGLLTAASVGLGGCSSDSSAGPSSGTIDNSPLSKASFLFDVDLKSGTVSVKDPSLKLDASLGGIAGSGPRRPSQSYSVLSNDAILITASNFQASPVGAVVPNKVRVTFDVAISNKLPALDLITPSFPPAPAGQTGLLLIPYSTSILTTSGGTGTQGGTTVIFERPSNGSVTPNIYWNGNAALDKTVTLQQNPGPGGDPFNFFNDASCTAPSSDELPSDCYRYETFGIVGATATATRRVGFDVDAGVGEFRVRMIAAADLNPRGTGTTGTVTGTVSSPGRGNLAGVTVTLSGPLVAAPLSATTNASGVFTISGAPLGTHDLQLSNLPSGCSNGLSWPAVTVVGGATATQNFSVTCSALVGTVNGLITRSGTGTQDLSAVGFTINPDAAGAPDVTGIIGTGLSYSALVQIGTGTGAGSGVVTLSGIPSGCIAPPAGSYSGLTAGGTQSVPFTISCTDPVPVTNQFASAWGTPSGGFVNLNISYTPATGIGFAGVQAITALTGPAAGRLTAVSGIATGVFATPTIGGTLPTVTWLTTTTSANQTGLTPVATLQFLIGSGAGGSVTTATTVQEISNLAGDAISLTGLTVVEATLNLP